MLREQAGAHKGVISHTLTLFADAIDGDNEAIRLSILVILVMLALVGMLVSISWYTCLDGCGETVTLFYHNIVSMLAFKRARSYAQLEPEPSDGEIDNPSKRGSERGAARGVGQKRVAVQTVSAKPGGVAETMGIPSLAYALQEDAIIQSSRTEKSDKEHGERVEGAHDELRLQQIAMEEAKLKWVETCSQPAATTASRPRRPYSPNVASSPPGLELPIPGGTASSFPLVAPIVTSRSTHSPPKSTRRAEGSSPGAALPVHPLLHLPMKPPPLVIPPKRARSRTPKRMNVQDLPNEGEQALASLRAKLRSISLETPRQPPSYRAPSSARARSSFLEEVYHGLASNPDSVSRPVDTYRSNSSCCTTPSNTHRSGAAIGDLGVAGLFGAFFPNVDSQRSTRTEQEATTPPGVSEGLNA